MRRKVILILVDALRFDYITEESMPFLHSKLSSSTVYKRIKPSPGYCERTEILYGLSAAESGFFTALGFSERNKDLRTLLLSWIERKVRFLLGFLRDDVERYVYSVYHRIVLLALRKISKRYHKNCYKIPHHLINDFVLTEDSVDMMNENFIGKQQSLVSLVESNGGRVYKNSFTSLSDFSNSSDRKRCEEVVSVMADYDFFPLYIDSVDKAGHEYGPFNKEMADDLRATDERLKMVFEAAMKVDANTRIYILGDHGMSFVTNTIDAGSIIRKMGLNLGLKEGKDFTYFLDSTVIRVWFHSSLAKQKMPSELKNAESFKINGIFIDKTNFESVEIPINGRVYGDVLWIANNGTLIFPDFFRLKKPAKGMHGYIPVIEDNFGTCVVINADNISESEDVKNLKDIYKEISNEYN